MSGLRPGYCSDRVPPPAWGADRRNTSIHGCAIIGSGFSVLSRACGFRLPCDRLRGSATG